MELKKYIKKIFKNPNKYNVAVGVMEIWIEFLRHYHTTSFRSGIWQSVLTWCTKSDKQSPRGVHWITLMLAIRIHPKSIEKSKINFIFIFSVPKTYETSTRMKSQLFLW